MSPGLRTPSLLALALVLVATTMTEAHADGWSTTPSIAAAGLARAHDGTRAAVAIDLRLEVLFGDISRPRFGAFVDGRVTEFAGPGPAELSGAMGLSVSLPTSAHDGATAFVLSSGAALHSREGETVQAGLARLFWGVRATPQARLHYEIAVGLWTEARYFPCDRSVDVLLGVSVDFYALALPIIFLTSAYR